MAERVKSGQAPRSGVMLGCALLAACEIVPDPSAPDTVAQVSRPATASQAPAPRRDERQPVALLVPLTGPDAPVGRSIANAADLALAEGAGARIRITTYDTAPGAAAAARDAMAAGHRVLLGPLLAEDVRAVAPLARGAGAPVIAFSNDARVAGNGVYLLGFTPAQSIDRIVADARRRGVERFAGLLPAGLYGERAGQALAAAVERSGSRLVALETYAKGAGRAAAGRLTGAPQAVLIADNARAAAEIAPAVRGGALILGTELWAAEPRLAGLGALRDARFAAASVSGFDALRPRYRARFGTDPYRLASLGYDAAALAAAVAVRWPTGQAFPEATLRSQSFTGVDGSYRFWRDGVADRGLQVLQVGPRGAFPQAEAPE